MAADVASKVPFYQLCALLEKISKRSGNDAKKKLLKEFIDEWRDFHQRLHAGNENTTDSFYGAMRLLLPHLERQRDAYGIKEHTLAKLYIEILGLGRDSPSALKLLNFRAPKSAKGESGDFASVAYWILKPRCCERGTLSVGDVNRCLDNIAAGHAAKSKEVVRKNLLHMLKETSALEQKWLIRMIMKDMKMGLSQQSVFSLYHEDAEDLFNVKMSLEKVCVMLRDPRVRLHEVEISVLTPFRPMLGDRGTPNKIGKLLCGRPFHIETKYDGERMQLHKQGHVYKFFSRSGNEYTHVFGGDSMSGTFTRHIAACFKDSVHSCILDGEMVGYNPETKTIGSKGEQFDIKSTNLTTYQPMMFVFDILQYNHSVLSNKPLKERCKILKDVFDPIEGRIKVSEVKIGSTKQDCVNALNEAIDLREEGIMVKDPDTPYCPNKRKGGWYKIKPEYIGGLMDELDVVVVGGYFGAGARAGMMSHFLCAVAVPPETGGKPSRFQSFCKVGSGYTRRELFEFNRKMADHWTVFDKKNPPQWLHLASGLKQRPDAWIEPSNSSILQIKAAEIVDSDQYKTGCTLRFPRVEKIRDDKPWYDCMTTHDIEELWKKSSGKLAGRYAEVDEDEDAGPVKKRRVTTARHVRPTVMDKFKATDVSGVTQVSEMLCDKEVCVINGPVDQPKAALEKLVAELGGSFVQNPGEETFCVLADKVNLKVRNIMKKGVYDVVRAQWLLRCRDQGQLLPWNPSDMIHKSPKTAAQFALDYDRHGDSYYDDATVESLKKVFEKIQEEGNAKCAMAEDIAECEMEYFPQDSPYGLFRLCRVYLDSNILIGDSTTHIKDSPLELTALELRLHGATQSDTLTRQVSHVIVDSRDLRRVCSLREENRRRERKFHIVSQLWVQDCLEQGTLLGERGYEPESH
ncbi:hypothetical protein NP493_548g00024 [Ridgeia piscesae]|uniref:DNA ligase n=1 Tax=Ridgeia piscesae TaxID=27915 RepID=A0AAD9KVR6_RIDPI|nr:hypothetical protein NP493_548g00024 [Ridgeia piscesae]